MEEIGKKKILYEIYINLKVKFSIFRFFYGFSGHYISFLNLNEDEFEKEDDYLPNKILKRYVEPSLKTSLVLLDKIFQKYPKDKIDKGVKLLLKSINWKLHLVALMAILKMEKKEQSKFSEILWDLAKKEYSWVLPQIYATLSFIDEQFIDKSKVILKSRGRDIFDDKEYEIDYLLKNLECMEKAKEDYDAYSVAWRIRVMKLKLDNSYQFSPTIL